jgi:hypothetical protein
MKPSAHESPLTVIAGVGAFWAKLPTAYMYIVEAQLSPEFTIHKLPPASNASSPAFGMDADGTTLETVP